MNTVEDGRLMVALGKNLIALVESMEDCMAKGRLLPCLVLFYSAIDIVASLESGKASGSAFMAWSDKYHTFLQPTMPSNAFGSNTASASYFLLDVGRGFWPNTGKA